MCRTCLSSPCHPRCPNAEPEKPIHTCHDCGKGIYHEDKYAEIGGVTYCLNCLESMEIEELLKLFDVSVLSAYEEVSLYGF